MTSRIEPPPVSGCLPHIGALRFAGSDAAGFLQGQVSNDTRRLGAGEALLAAYSSPQGRVIALMHLIPHSSGILALLPRELIPVTLERLRRYILRSKVTIADVSADFVVLGRHIPDAPGTGAAGSGPPLPHATGRYEEAGGIGVARIGADSSRCWVLGSAGDFASPPATDPQAEHDWRLADIRSGIPQVYAATSELFVAQMLNLDLIDGISFSKGCFTGQEIIARTQHLGRIKRRLHRLRLPEGNWTVGMAVQLADGRSGRLTEVASTAEGHEALAVLHADSSTPGSADTPTAPAGDAATIIDAVELPLPYS